MKFRGSKKIKFSIQQVYKKQTNKTKYCPQETEKQKFEEENNSNSQFNRYTRSILTKQNIVSRNKETQSLKKQKIRSFEEERNLKSQFKRYT